MVLEAIIARLQAAIPEFGGRVYGAADLGRLMTTGGRPQVTPCAHVVPTGIAGGRTEPLLGMFRQDVDWLVAILVTVRASDPTGGKVLGQADQFLTAIIESLAGWSPVSSRGVFKLGRAQLLAAAEGSFTWEITFGLADELRIET